MIMAIHPNTMGFGYVILTEEGEILDYGITTVRPIKNEKCIEKILELINYYKPKTLILEDYLTSIKSERIKELTKKISKNLNDNLLILKYTKDQIKDTFEIFGARNKYEISKKIVEVFPQFKTKLPDKRKPWEPENYYQGLFDAMALVLTYMYLND
jgi:Holliday junction resolvasome RuvABC endonuclease subunit